MITYKIHLIRTGRTWDNPWKRYVGQSDIPLSEKGAEELREMRGRFDYPRAEKVFSSPLRRCLQTAEILYPGIGANLLDGLADMNLGAFEGKTFDELRGDEAFTKWLDNSFENTPPGGEPVGEFTQRVVRTLDRIFRTMLDERIASAAVITHGGVIMTLLAGIGLPKLPLHQWAVKNGTGYTLLMSTQMWMRDRAAEIQTLIPAPRKADSPDD